MNTAANTFKAFALLLLGLMPWSFCLADDDYPTEGKASSYHPEYYDKQYGLTPEEQRGRDVWYLWTGYNETTWREMAKTSEAKVGFRIDMLQLIDAKQFPRKDRWDVVGAIQDPLCKAAIEPDEYGLWIDQCESEGAPDIPNEPTGIVGMRKIKNPKFDPEKWDAEKYWKDPTIEPPYLVGLSCGVCHIAFNPLDPPDDPRNPEWKNLAGTIGNQYLREGQIFAGGLATDDFRWHVASTQQPGTSDTSRMAADHINNPNAINPIFELANRPSFDEEVPENVQKLLDYTPGDPLHHILKDGSDSVGVPAATLRVYINIGMCGDYWFTRHDVFTGKTEQKPFDVAAVTDPDSEYYCQGWVDTAKRTGDAFAFLKSNKAMHLNDADGGKGARFLSQDKEVLHKGAVVFAENCAQCHSSKQPGDDVTGDARDDWYRESVLSEDFLKDNFLSDDKRYPVTQIGTNAARSLGRNPLEGHIWAQMSSTTFKNLPSAGTITVDDVFAPGKTKKFKMPAGGRGYYRTPSLVSVWATAPLLHNNSLGMFNNDPSVRGRVLAYEDAMRKLLWPEKRDYIVKRTSVESYLKVPEPGHDGVAQRIRSTALKATIRKWNEIYDKDPAKGIYVPAGTPVNLIANLDITEAKIGNLLSGMTKLLKGEAAGKIITNYDWVEDRGHLHAGQNLEDDEKEALIEFVRTF